jgi:tetratricopeptide (TPR) repeat protein
MSRGLVTSSRYSPGNMRGEALERLFVGRDSLMKEVLKRITASATRAEKHFLLLVGPRGMGKTHFVSFAHHKLKNDAAYAKALSRLKIAYLNEEEWGVASFLDLLVRILRALVAEHEDPALKAGIEQVYEAFKRNPDTALEQAESLLVRFLQGYTLLLICENLEDLFEGLGEEGQQRWRSFIQEYPFWTILATTPALFSGIRLQTSPFYNFFTIKSLERLDFDTALELLRKKALLEGRPKLADFLRTPTGRARVRAIHHLAGGNHRVYVIMSDFLDEESLEDLFTPFMRMADDLTPYYQDKMRQLAPQQRKLVEFLSQEARPVIVKDIASRCLLSPQVAAKQLGELAKLNFVMSNKVGRESYYELSEPLMRICVDIKDNRTDHFKLFVEFLRYWFTGRELQDKLEALKNVDSSTSHVDRLHFNAALQDFVSNPREPFLDSLDAEILQCVKNKDFQGIVDTVPRFLQERPSANFLWAATWAFVGLNQLEIALDYVKRGLEKYPGNPHMLFLMALILTELKRPQEGIEYVRVAVANWADPDAISLVAYGWLLVGAGRVEEAFEVGQKVLALEPEHHIGLILIARALLGLRRYSEAEDAYRRCLKQDLNDLSLLLGFTRVLRAQGKFVEAIESLESVPAMLQQDAAFLSEYGAALAGVNRLSEAVSQFDKALELKKNDAWVYAAKAQALLQSGQREAARDACLAVLTFSCTEEEVLTLVGILHRAGYPQEMVSLLDHAQLESSPSASAWTWRAKALVLAAQFKKAHAAINHARQLAPTDMEIAVEELGILAGAAGFGMALEAAGKILANTSRLSSHEVFVVGLCNVLFVESTQRGAIAMARQMPQFRQLLANHGQMDMIGEVLSVFVRAGLKGKHFLGGEWPLALPGLQEALEDLPQCRIPLQVLSVAIRYEQRGDKAILLELPLEQRTLLMDLQGASGSPGLSIEQDAASAVAKRGVWVIR